MLLMPERNLSLDVCGDLREEDLPIPGSEHVFYSRKGHFFFLFVLWVDINKINKVYMVFFVFLESLLLAFKEDHIIQMVH